MHHDEHDKGQLALEVKSAPEPDFWVSKPEQKETRWVLSMMLVAIILTCLSLPLNILAVGSYNGTKECVVKPHPKGGDSVPAILNAFRECGQNGKITFLNETYNINTVMTTTGLNNVEVDIQGTLLVSSPAGVERLLCNRISAVPKASPQPCLSTHNVPIHSQLRMVCLFG